jgi:Ras-related protein Rab-24
VADFRDLKTVGAAFAAKKVTVDDRDITLGVWGSSLTCICACFFLGGGGCSGLTPFPANLADTAGQERYESMSRIYYRSARCAIVCWGEAFLVLFLRDRLSDVAFHSLSLSLFSSSCSADMTEPQTFEKVRFWVDELMANEPTCVVFITGTKGEAEGCFFVWPLLGEQRWKSGTADTLLSYRL